MSFSLSSSLQCAGGLVLVGLLASLLLPMSGRSAEPAFVFSDATTTSGLLPSVAGIRGHTAGWGDADGDGWLDLFVGTFYNAATKPNLFYRNRQGKFELQENTPVSFAARANSSLFADFDNDGDADLYVASMPVAGGKNKAQQEVQPLLGCRLFRNEGGGKFVDVSPGNGACPTAFGGRSATACDFDGDSLLDLLVGEDPLPGYNGSPTKSSRLFKNLGDLQFEDVSQKVGLPLGVPGLGVAVGDVNNDRWPDFFLACHAGGNQLFLNDGKGNFQPAAGNDVFAWPTAKGDDMVCGVTLSDANRDGWLDIVLGQHFEKPWVTPVANRLYLNQGNKAGKISFVDVTEKVGLVPLPMKGPHVELNDFDNDGWPDLSTSIVKFANGQPHPLIFKHLGIQDGLPRFECLALGVNDFPTPDDQAVKRTGTFFEKMVADQKIMYAAPAPSGDYDRDGRLDLFLASWWPEAPSLLLHNETLAGHSLTVCVKGTDKLNRQGVGARINIYPAGQLGKADALLGTQEIALGYGYVSGHAAEAHFGLGTLETVDVEVILPHDLGQRTRTDVAADQKLMISE